MLVPPAAFGARGTSFINVVRNINLMTGLQGCYDFGDVNCYVGSGQTIKDLSGQGNDIFNGDGSGTTTLDMAFNGVAGRLSAAEFFEKNAVTGNAIIGGAVPTWMQAVHKDNGKISIASWTKTPSGTYNMGSFSDAVTPSTGAAAGPGFNFGVSNGVFATLGYPIFSIFDAASANRGFFAGSAVVPNTGGWSFSGCAIDEQAGTAVIQIDAVQYSGAISYAAPAATAAGAILVSGPSAATTHDKAGFVFWDRSIGAAGLDAFYKATKGQPRFN